MQTFSVNYVRQLEELVELFETNNCSEGFLECVYQSLKVNRAKAVVLIYDHICKEKLIKLTDAEVEEIWYPRESLLDELPNELVWSETWSEKQKAIASMYERKEKIDQGLYRTTYQNVTFVVDLENGMVYRFDNRGKKLINENGSLYLKPLFSNKKTLVYNEKRFFNVDTQEGLLTSKEKFGKSKCSGVKLNRNDFRSESLYFRDHQLITGLYYGRKAIDAFADGNEATRDVNHRNRCPHDNRIFNLEIITKSENRRHAIITEPLLKKKKEEFLKAVLRIVQ